MLFGHLGKVHAVVLWLSATVYAAAVIVGIAEADATSGSAGDRVGLACLLITTVVGGLQALVFTIVAIANNYRLVRLGTTRAATRAATRDSTPEAAPGVRVPARHRRVERIATALGVVLVIALFPILLFLLVNDALFQRDHQDAQATIVSFRVDAHCTGGYASTCTDQYYPTVRFTTGRGETIQTETSDSRSEHTSTIKAGRIITVHYDPSDPRSDVRLGTGWGSDDVLIIVLVIIIYGCLGFAVVRSRRRTKPTGLGSAHP